MVKYKKIKGTLLLLVAVLLLSVAVLAAEEVYLGGFPFGVHMKTQGVYVCEIGEINGSDGKVCPAKDAGIAVGDIIISINGEKTEDVEQVAHMISDSQGKMLKLDLKRGEKSLSANLVPIKTLDTGEYKTGLFIKDRASGIGTVTFVASDKRTFGGLGHGITDRNTAGILPLGDGTVHNVEITDVAKGNKDMPGELKGTLEYAPSGELLKNTEMGIFGRLKKGLAELEKIPVASRSEVKEGECTVYTCLDGSCSKGYKAKIAEIVDKNSKTKNFIVTLTDKEALAKTGGIVQGMSGSPVVQNGKLVGAVTHVLMRDQTSGYGIFIENMLSEAE